MERRCIKIIREKIIMYRGNRSQSKMAKLYQVTQQAWSKWENGESTPSLKIIKQIEKDSDIPMEELFPDVFNNLKLWEGSQFNSLYEKDKSLDP